MGRRAALRALSGLTATLSSAPALLAPQRAWAGATSAAPVLVGLDGEFGHASSTSAEAIKQGLLIALEEINGAGGVLGGRSIRLIERANHAVPARSVANLNEFAAMDDLVAVFCGRFSPTVLEVLPLIATRKLPLLDPWAAADAIVDNGQRPNYVFRLSLRDSWAAPAMLGHLGRRGVTRAGLMMLNTSWGRGTKLAAERALVNRRKQSIVGTQWINWDDSEESMAAKYQALVDAGAEGIVLTANAEEAAVLLKHMLRLPKDRRVPVASHWGVTGGDLPKLVGAGFLDLDLAVVQTYSFLGDNSSIAKRVVTAHQRLFGSRGPRDIASPVGVAHAYDLAHVLARAVDLAGTTARPTVRDALERTGAFQGLVRRYAPAFTAARHEALDEGNVIMCRYAADGALEPIRRA
ncbi:MAG: ABC transporter substrate-binding protein [Aquincola sp.]|nr:ABC transporter substrate-binding protein [Aquincola sp.]